MEMGPLVRARRDHAIATLQLEFAGTLSPDTVTRFVITTFDELLAKATVPNFLPLIGEGLSRERLRALNLLHVDPRHRTPQVLFVCEHNSGRSQLAAALTDAFAAGRVGVWSAGRQPTEQLEDHVVEVLAEIDVSVRDAFPKPLLDEVVAAADVVITMGCGDACPILDGKRYEDWQIPDPAGLDLAAVRAVRYELAHRVLALLADLAPDLQPRPLPLL